MEVHGIVLAALAMVKRLPQKVTNSLWEKD